MGEKLARTDGPYKPVLPQLDDEWMQFGNCRNQFWVEPDPDEAIKVCEGCPVIAECKQMRADLNAVGVWGGEYWYYTSRSGVRRRLTKAVA